ncbi:hypothetical protein [Vulgatibacter incomptus]|uniref:Type V secretory pathway, adhesin AidA n=1 Tax=Vulgatibacter incomptus TaxID=1391653 RepID=A0A0K1P8V3_9BACT|nr:hypothetical protein [Vulgatibacter incomptus]AKU89937.1 Type V secretory pathway, adhesin AidA [Vulgatibacter incomptus]
MFSIDPMQKHIEASPDRILSIVESINSPFVAVPGRESQATSAFIVGLRSAEGHPGLVVHLWLSQAREAVIYTPDDAQEARRDYQGAMNAALEFCESMGFMMEDVPFRELTPEAQWEILGNLPPFQRDPAPSRLAGSSMLQPVTAGPSMNSPFITSATPGPELFLEELVEPLDEAPLAPVDVSKLARLLASF